MLLCWLNRCSGCSVTLGWVSGSSPCCICAWTALLSGELEVSCQPSAAGIAGFWLCCVSAGKEVGCLSPIALICRCSNHMCVLVVWHQFAGQEDTFCMLHWQFHTLGGAVVAPCVAQSIGGGSCSLLPVDTNAQRIEW